MTHTRTVIRSVLQRCDLSPAALAAKLGVSLERVKSLSVGRSRAFTSTELRAFVEVLRVRPEFLITGRGDVVEVKRAMSARAIRKARAAGASPTSWSAAAAAMPARYEGLVNEILVGVALADETAVRRAIDSFVADAANRRSPPLGVEARSVGSRSAACDE
jgi:hypothetical protein